jgi:predicted transporter
MIPGMLSTVLLFGLTGGVAIGFAQQDDGKTSTTATRGGKGGESR